VVTPYGTSYLEARSSRLPTDPPGTVLMIRDVTASKAAEQTIRTLFQFLQDRDEDRTRLLKRTNAAIEAERNRIARDLHDGPIQGISASTLSLEAVRMMLEQGDMARAIDTLRKICQELGEEAMNLRRIMSDLRPPVLEERGLVPAVRELCDRWQEELGIRVQVIADPHPQAPRDVETLAYRVVQEALSNVKKHAAASEVTVRIEAAAGILRVEVRDDGVGFDSREVREFLRAGKVGLASMRERAELAGGTLTVKSEPGAGTTVTATLPFEVLSGPTPLSSRA
jgi:signal transduction histidine kinase